MQLVYAGFLGYCGAAAGFLLLGLLVVYWWNNALSGVMLFVASLLTCLWAGVSAYDLHSGFANGQVSQVLEIFRSAGWILLPLSLLNWIAPAQRSAWASIIIGICVCLAALTLFSGANAGDHSADARQLVVIGGHLGLALIGLALAENLLRNSSQAQSWTIRYLCFGVGGLFAYDFLLYSDALLFRRLDLSLFLARGITNLLVAPLFALYVARNRMAGPRVVVSRRFVFHSATLVGAGLYLMTMAAAGYYVRQFGGTWSTFLQAVFFFGALWLLILPIASASFRAYLRVLIEKSFFKYKYDYRAEWLRFIQTIAGTHEVQELRSRIIKAVGDIVESPDGVLWIHREAGTFSLAASWNASKWNLTDGQVAIEAASALAQFLEQTHWIVNLVEYAETPERYKGLTEIPEFLRSLPRAWLVIPLLLHDRLFGIMVLGHSRAERSLTWEDFDILKTVGRQAASYLAQRESDEALAEAREFEAFNKRFAFVAHDIKNLTSQLSLILTNAARHRGNAKFQDDMIETVRQSVEKLNRMLRQLSARPQRTEPTPPVELTKLLRDIVARRTQAQDLVSLDLRKESVTIAADEDRLRAVVDHLVQNALDAVGKNGRVEVRLSDAGAMAAVEIEDNGPGMDPEFVRDRLFRPFDSTKGSGYGIGVYESREFARSLGGKLEVISHPGRGTIMRMCLPTVDAG